MPQAVANVGDGSDALPLARRFVGSVSRGRIGGAHGNQHQHHAQVQRSLQGEVPEESDAGDQDTADEGPKMRVPVTVRVLMA